MGALVIYESMFGNTKRVAEAIAAGIGERMPVELVEVSHAPLTLDPDLDLLVVGGPTHVHGMTTARTRSDAANRSPGPLVSLGIGMREWLEQLGPMTTATPAAAFDTRINGPKVLTGSAAGSFSKRLKGAGFRLASDPESFRIATKAPQDDALLDGEVNEAREWGRALAATVPAKSLASRSAPTQPVMHVDGPHVGQTLDGRDAADEDAPEQVAEELRRGHDL
jgi:Flavodoxins